VAVGGDGAGVNDGSGVDGVGELEAIVVGDGAGTLNGLAVVDGIGEPEGVGTLNGLAVVEGVVESDAADEVLAVAAADVDALTPRVVDDVAVVEPDAAAETLTEDDLDED
jgi:hypothetical protein